MGAREKNCYQNLKQKYKVQFEEKNMPEKKEAEQAMTDRQLDLLEKSPAMAFEGFLPLARELQKNEKSDLLIAKALYGFFKWDRKETQPQREEPRHHNRNNNRNRKPTHNRRS